MNGGNRILLVLLLVTAIPSWAMAQRPQRGQSQRGQNRSEQGQSSKSDNEPTIPGDWMSQVKWRSIGPANMGGRITSIAVYEKDPCIWWAASASGGLLKTINNGISFEHQFDKQATVSIGDVQVSQSNPEIVWVGTGEANPRNSVSWGDGVYKSTDGGKTWKNMGLKKSFQIGRIAIHPENPDIVYVGTLGRLWGPNEERGLFKTTDGGKNWEKVLFVDDKTGVIDVKMNPKDPDELIVATYERKRDGFDGNDPEVKYGEGSGIYKTTDGGENFEKLAAGLPSCKMGRIGLDYYRKDPKYIYAVIESEKIAMQPETAGYLGVRGENADVGAKITTVAKNSPAEKAGIEEDDIIVTINKKIVHSFADLEAEARRYKKGDKLKVAISRNREPVELEIELAAPPKRRRSRRSSGRKNGNLQSRPYIGTLGGQAANLQGQQGAENEEEFGGVYMSKDGGSSWKRINTLNPRPMYYSQIRVDPTDRNHVFILGTSLYRSKDGGEKFTGDGGQGVHPDNHSMWIDPRDGRHMILGNDGGVYVTYDRMDKWDHHSHFAIGQFYHVGVDHNLNYKVYGGLQDNGSWGGPSKTNTTTGPVNTDWFRVGGGDGFICLVDPEDADQIYVESQNGAMQRINLRTGENGFIRARAERGQRFRFNWKTPFILSPHNSQIHYSGGNFVFRSVSKGQNGEAISPEITNTDRGAASAITESPMKAGVIYVGTTDGAVWVTRDGGAEWTPLYLKREKKEEKSDEKDDADKDDSDKSDESEQEKEKPMDSADKDEPEKAESKPESESAKSESGVEKSASDKPADPITGKWTGELQMGRNPEPRPITIELKLGEDGKKLSGAFISRQGEREISEGSYDAKSGEVEFYIEADRFDIEFIGELSDGTLEGTLSFADGRFEAEVTLKRKSDDGDGDGDGDGNANAVSIRGPFADPVPARQEEGQEEKENKPSGDDSSDNEQDDSQSQDETSGQEEKEKPEDKSSTETKAVKDHPLAGDWDGQFVLPDSDEEGRGKFTMTLKADDDGMAVGSYESDYGTGDIVESTFNEESGKVSLIAESEQATLEFAGDYKNGVIRGQIEINDGAFSIEFTATRKVKTEEEEGESEKETAEQESSESASQEEEKDDASEKMESEEKSAEKSDEESDEKSDAESDADDEPKIGTSNLHDLLPGPRWVSSLEASRFRPGRCYVSFDGHRNNDDEPYVFVTENYGKTWKSIRANLPTSAGSVRVLREDVKNQNLLYLGCEFSAWVSVDRGKSWSKFTGLPTVAVHEIAVHPTAGEIVAATHGRSLWVADVHVLRQLSEEALSDDFHLFEPKTAIRWRRGQSRGESGTRRFTGSNPELGTTISYHLKSMARSVKIEVNDLKGNTVAEFDGEGDSGLHSIQWDLRRQASNTQSNRGGQRRGGFRGAARVPTGTYVVQITVDGERQQQSFRFENDPDRPAAVASETEIELWRAMNGLDE